MDWIPSSVPHLPRPPGSLAGSASPEVPAPSNGILARAPCGPGRFAPDPVPLSGFLNPSAVS